MASQNFTSKNFIRSWIVLPWPSWWNSVCILPCDIQLVGTEWWPHDRTQKWAPTCPFILGLPVGIIPLPGSAGRNSATVSESNAHLSASTPVVSSAASQPSSPSWFSVHGSGMDVPGRGNLKIRHLLWAKFLIYFFRTNSCGRTNRTESFRYFGYQFAKFASISKCRWFFCPAAIRSVARRVQRSSAPARFAARKFKLLSGHTSLSLLKIPLYCT